MSLFPNIEGRLVKASRGKPDCIVCNVGWFGSCYGMVLISADILRKVAVFSSGKVVCSGRSQRLENYPRKHIRIVHDHNVSRWSALGDEIPQKACSIAIERTGWLTMVKCAPANRSFAASVRTRTPISIRFRRHFLALRKRALPISQAQPVHRVVLRQHVRLFWHPGRGVRRSLSPPHRIFARSTDTCDLFFDRDLKVLNCDSLPGGHGRGWRKDIRISSDM